jgi:hypothetical protein
MHKRHNNESSRFDVDESNDRISQKRRSNDRSLESKERRKNSEQEVKGNTNLLNQGCTKILD